MEKQIILLGIFVLLVCVGLSGCEEKTINQNEEVDIEKMILGSWRWVETIGIFDGNTTSFNETENEMIYTFYNNGTMKYDSDIDISFPEFISNWGNYKIENNKLIGSLYGLPTSSMNINISEDGKYLTLIAYGVYPNGKIEKTIIKCVKLE